jgi:hypothetical protein
MRLVVQARPAAATDHLMQGLFTADPVIVTDDGAGVAPAVVELLEARGLSARVLGRAEEVPAQAGVVIFLGGLRAVRDIPAATSINREAFRAARAVAGRFSRAGGIFVTVQDTGGDFGLSGRSGTRAWLSGLPGLVKTAAQEWPSACVKSIDVECSGRPAEELARAIVEEIVSGGPELEVGLLVDGTRTTLDVRPAAARAGEAVLDSRSLVVASGGGRGVTAACLIALAREHRPRMVLLGRTDLADEPAGLRAMKDESGLGRVLLEQMRGRGLHPSPVELRSEVQAVLARRAIHETLEALRGAGSEARYVRVDVRDAADVADVLRDVRRTLGPVTALVHGAGTLLDKLIADKTPQDFDAVFDTKVLGLASLLAATRDDPLRLIALFSSVAARGGNAGQCDYAMANEVLNKVAAAEARRRGGECVVKSLNWGPWDGGMVSATLRRHFQDRGVPLLAPERGSRMFLEEIRTGAGEVEVVLGGGASTLATTQARPRAETVLQIQVDARTHPYLNSHRVRDVPVVPVALALEWFARAAAACRPDLVLSTLRDVRVQRGIRLERFHDGGELFTVTCREISNGSRALLSLELRGRHERADFTATAEMVERAASPAALVLAPREAALEPPPWPASQVYGHLLFHGPDFRVIRSLEGVAPEGSSALLCGTRDVGWTGGPWQTDPAALDGGLQLAILWGVRALGKPTLPTRVGAFVRHRESTLEGPIRCSLQSRALSTYRTVCDIFFSGADGSLLAELREVEMHVTSGSRSLDEDDREPLATPTPS